MTNKRDVDKNDMVPQAEEPVAPDPITQAQKDAAEERSDEGGYQ